MLRILYTIKCDGVELFLNISKLLIICFLLLYTLFLSPLYYYIGSSETRSSQDLDSWFLFGFGTNRTDPTGSATQTYYFWISAEATDIMFHRFLQNEKYQYKEQYESFKLIMTLIGRSSSLTALIGRSSSLTVLIGRSSSLTVFIGHHLSLSS